MRHDFGHLTVVNQSLVKSLAARFDIPVEGATTVEGSASLSTSALGLSRKKTEQRPARELDDPRLLDRIVSELRDRGLLRAFRPDRSGEFWRSDYEWFVYEQTLATPVTIPGPENYSNRETSRPPFTVWVLDPIDPRDIPRDEWDWLGAFVFIVQEIADASWPMPWFISGMSSLRLVLKCIADEGAASDAVVERLADFDDVFGRWHAGHPIDKLERVGGIRQRTRKITTVYKIVYMTDEQSITTESGEGRINDIMAYPLLIGEQ